MTLNKTIAILSLLLPSFVCMGMDRTSNSVYTTNQITDSREQELKMHLYTCISLIASARTHSDWENTHGYLFPTTGTPRKPSKVLNLVAQRGQQQEILVPIDLSAFYASFK